jgi:crotonobetainyl-CoA:carnitine CoA-transferase CaiB-like acyl-CoA transferase
MSDTPPRVRRPPPLLGEHTDEVLNALADRPAARAHATGHPNEEPAQ